MLDCSTVFPLLSALMDDELDDETRTAVTAHLAECAICTDRLDRMRALRDELRDMVDDEPPQKFAEEAETWVRAQPTKRGWWPWGKDSD